MEINISTMKVLTMLYILQDSIRSEYVYTLCLKNPTFLDVTRKSIVGFL